MLHLVFHYRASQETGEKQHVPLNVVINMQTQRQTTALRRGASVNTLTHFLLQSMGYVPMNSYKVNVPE